MKTRVTMRLPNSLQRAATEFAARDWVSLNGYVARALAEKVGGRGAAEWFAERGKGGEVVRAVAFLEGRGE